MVKLPIATLAAALLIAAPAPASPRADVRAVVAAGAPGAVAYVDGHAAAAGLADARTGRRLTPADHIRIGSVTKSFTAVVALQLVAEGRLQLGDTVGERLPGVFPAADRVTLRQLLNHTSGIPDDVTAPLGEVLGGNPLRVWTPEEILDLVRGEPLRFCPGKGWAYSNTDYVLAGLMIERATGRSLEQQLESRIVRPLHLRDTSFPVREPGLGRPFSHGYTLAPDGSGPARDITTYSPSFAWASGNGVSTVRDVARFYAALLRGRLLRPRELREALTPVGTGRPGRSFGLGLELRDTPSGPSVGHEGDILGFSIKALFSPDGRHRVVLAVNEKFASKAVDDAFDAAADDAWGQTPRRSGMK
jgi:D-alanyl-D-alanine carboxypeptidase